MKYPEKQFQKLTEGLKTLSKYFDIKNINPSNLHYLVYQQYCGEGQEHNAIYILNDNLIKKHKISDTEISQAQRLFSPCNTFELYPDGCNDSHIESAVKKALKTI